MGKLEVISVVITQSELTRYETYKTFIFLFISFFSSRPPLVVVRTDGIGRGSRKKGGKRKNDNHRDNNNNNNNNYNTNNNRQNDDDRESIINDRNDNNKNNKNGVIAYNSNNNNNKNPRMREGRDEVGENNGKQRKQPWTNVCLHFLRKKITWFRKKKF